MRSAMAVMITLIALAVAYFGSYPILLKPKIHYGVGGVCGLSYERAAAYQLGGNISTVLFTPLQWVDQKIRPTFWRGSIAIDASDLNIPIKGRSLVPLGGVGTQDEEAQRERERPGQVPRSTAKGDEEPDGDCRAGGAQLQCK